MLEDKLNQDLKAAMIAGDKPLVTTLRGLKSALLYAKIAGHGRDKAMPDAEVVTVLQKEAKKRQESADLYLQGGSHEKADAELFEKQVIEQYLPAQLAEDDVKKLVEEAVNELGTASQANMGQLISAVRQKAAGAADGALIARLVKERLPQ